MPKSGVVSRQTSLLIRVTPRAPRNALVGILDDGTLKIQLKAPPLEGRANQELIEFLGELFEITQSNIKLAAGTKGRLKRVVIQNVDEITVWKMIHSKMD